MEQGLSFAEVKVDVKVAIDLTKQAFALVSKASVAHCWRHTGIVPTVPAWDGLRVDATAQSAAIEGLAETITRLPGGTLANADQYVDVDDETCTAHVPTEEEILEELIQAERGDESEEDEEDDEDGGTPDLQAVSPAGVAQAMAMVRVGVS